MFGKTISWLVILILLLVITCNSFAGVTVQGSGQGMITAAVAGGETPVKFSDIAKHWAKDYIEELAGKKIVGGVGGGRFAPDEMITRAEFIKMVVLAMGFQLQSGDYFMDTVNHWSDPYVDTAVANSIIDMKKYGDKEFNPNAPVLRSEMAEFLCKALKLEPSKSKNPFVDLQVNDGYAVKAYEEYLIAGVTVKGKLYFKPNNFTTRAEATTVIVRLIHYKEYPDQFKQEEKNKIAVANGNAAVMDKDFEAFANSEEASKYMSTNFFRVSNGQIILKDRGKEFAASNTDNKTINVMLYNIVNALVACARKNGDYVRVEYYSVNDDICIDYYQNQLIGEKAVVPGMFEAVLYVHPYLAQGNKFKNYISWLVNILWENYTASEEVIKNKCREQVYVDAMTKAYQTVYGDKDGLMMSNLSVKLYDLYRQKQIQGQNSYEMQKTESVNGLQVNEILVQGKVYIETNLK